MCLAALVRRQRDITPAVDFESERSDDRQKSTDALSDSVRGSPRTR